MEISNHIKQIFQGLQEFTNVKFALSIISPIGAFLFGMDHFVILQALVFLIVIDFITGVWSAYINKAEITSKGVVKSAYKLVVYGLMASGGHLTEVIVPGNFYLEEIITSFLALTELVSIIENIGKAGYAVPKKLLNKLQDLRDSK